MVPTGSILTDSPVHQLAPATSTNVHSAAIRGRSGARSEPPAVAAERERRKRLLSRCRKIAV